MSSQKKYNSFDKKLAQECLNEGWGIIDTSGRTRDFTETSTIALCSNQIHFSIQFKPKIKKSIFEKYSRKYSQKKIVNMIHCLGLYYCLKNTIHRMPGVFICSDGLNPPDIVHYLKNLLGVNYDTQKIRIYRSLTPFLGKKNIGHKLAKKINKNKQKPTKQFSLKMFEEKYKL